MQGFAAILLIVQLLAHGVAGCCWHHEHADIADGGATAVAVAAGAEKTCCHHQAARDPSAPVDSKRHAPDEAPCDDSKCVLGISRIRVDAEIPNQALHFVLAMDSCALPSDIRPATRHVCIEDIEPPLRLHALHRVLLI